MEFKTGNDWEEILREETEMDYFHKLMDFVDEEYETQTIYPPKEDVFNALKYCSFEDTKVVIMGQDPYINPGQAHGLCFSVNDGVDLPPSLINIFKEMKSDLGIDQPNNGNLLKWAKQGVLLLNATLTVRDGVSMSHKGKGWESFTAEIVSKLNDHKKPVVFILWGRNAQAKLEYITNPEHLILTGAHPSPLSASRGFFGGRYFSRTNRFLELTGQTPIDWQL